MLNIAKFCHIITFVCDYCITLRDISTNMGMTEQQLLDAGREAWRRQDWQKAINCYEEAIRLNPQSEALELKKMALDVLEFYNHDMLNP